MPVIVSGWLFSTALICSPAESPVTETVNDPPCSTRDALVFAVGPAEALCDAEGWPEAEGWPDDEPLGEGEADGDDPEQQ